MAYRLLKDGVIVPIHQEPIEQNGVVVSYNTMSEVGIKGQVFPEVGCVLASEIESGKHLGTWDVVSDEPEPVEAPDEQNPVDPHEHADETHEHATSYESMSSEDLAMLVRDHGVEVVGTGAGGNVLKRDMVAAIVEFHEQLEAT